MKNVAEDALNCGLGFLFVYYDDLGELNFKRFKPYEVIPHWLDDEHTKLDYLIRCFSIEIFENNMYRSVDKVEVYSPDGIDYYEYTNGNLKPVEPYHNNYFTRVVDGVENHYTWDKIHVILNIIIKRYLLLKWSKPFKMGLISSNLIFRIRWKRMQEIQS